ncbi:MAG: cell envelope integrity protein TolA [Burkholderiales bacterium]|nr:cell envelope integrity protein TolA [Burkholderiales bacterium]
MSVTLRSQRAVATAASAEAHSKAQAWLAAIIVHALLFAGLVFSVRWKHVSPEPVAVDLVFAPPAPIVTTPVAPTVPPPPPVPEPPPPPRPSPAPAKAPPAPVPPQKVAPPLPPGPTAADIARQKAAEKEAQRKAEAARVDALAREQAKLEAARKQVEAAAAKKADDARVREAKAAQEKALKEQQAAYAAAQATAERQAREAAQRAEADRVAKAAADAAAAAAAKARAKAEGDYVAKIRAKVRGNIILASELSGNPEAIFSVTQLPTGEVLSATLTKSSGNRAYDDAVERAILKSSPLPKPDQADVFQRQLQLKFRPQD